MTSISKVKKIRGLRQARAFLGLSLKQVGEMCGVSPSLIAAWQAGRRLMPRSAIDLIGLKIANELTREHGRDIGVTVEVNSPWAVTPFAKCADCREWFSLRSPRDRRCPRCREGRRG